MLPEEHFAYMSMPLCDLFPDADTIIQELYTDDNFTMDDCTKFTGASYHPPSVCKTLICALLAAPRLAP